MIPGVTCNQTKEAVFMPDVMSGLKIANITRGIWGFFSIFIYIETLLPFEMSVLEDL